MDWLGPLLGVFTGLAVLAFGGLLVYALLTYVRHDLRQWRDAMGSRDWPVTIGTVEKIDVEVDGSVRRRMYYPRVSFRYQVDGKTHTSTRWRFASTWSEGSLDRASAEKSLAPYQVGMMTGVYHHPNDPSRATLRREWPALWPWPLILLLSLFTYGVVWVGWNVLWEAVQELLCWATACSP